MKNALFIFNLLLHSSISNADLLLVLRKDSFLHEISISRSLREKSVELQKILIIAQRKKVARSLIMDLRVDLKQVAIIYFGLVLRETAKERWLQLN